MARPTTITTTYHWYRFDSSDPTQAAEYAALCAQLRQTPGRGHAMFALADPAAPKNPRDAGPHAQPITLETKHVFNNQWNEADTDGRQGWRVFDWYEAIHPNRSLHAGHYLDITPEMIEIRANTGTCGYCGAHYDKPWPTFCGQCLDSPHLAGNELHLLRIVSAAEHHAPGHHRAPLTEAEAADLTPRYTHAQVHGQSARGQARIAQRRADILHKAETTITNARDERDGLIWLLDHAINIENVIYYSHTGRFCFGWRKPLSAAEHSALVDVLVEFPYDYDLKTADRDPAGQVRR
jgi:hypothetical protein